MVTFCPQAEPCEGVFDKSPVGWRDRGVGRGPLNWRMGPLNWGGGEVIYKMWGVTCCGVVISLGRSIRLGATTMWVH